MNNTQDKNNPEETKVLDYYLGHKLPGRKHMDLFPAAGIRFGDRISLSEIWTRGWRYESGTLYDPLSG